MSRQATRNKKMADKGAEIPSRRAIARQLSSNGRDLLLSVNGTTPNAFAQPFSLPAQPGLGKQASYWFGPGSSSNPAVKVTPG